PARRLRPGRRRLLPGRGCLRAGAGDVAAGVGHRPGDGRWRGVRSGHASPGRGPRRMRRLIAVIVVLAVLGFGTSRALDWWSFNVNTPVSTTSHSVTFHVDPGETPTQIGNDLFNLRLIRSTVAFDLYTRLTDAGPKFQAGAFLLNTNMSLSQIVNASAGANGLVRAQRDQFDAVFSADWRAQIAQSTAARPKQDIRSIVILASMVDREANNKTASDRGNVCSVYYNRLRVNMTLGVDATLLYALHRLSPEPTAAELTLD